MEVLNPPVRTIAKLLPGMYAYGKVTIERTGVRAVPVDALVHTGSQTFCWFFKNGKAVRTELETGVSDDEWIEVTSHRTPVPRPVDPRGGKPRPGKNGGVPAQRPHSELSPRLRSATVDLFRPMCVNGYTYKGSKNNSLAISVWRGTMNAELVCANVTNQLGKNLIRYRRKTR